MSITAQQFHSAPHAKLDIPGAEPVQYRVINGTIYHWETPFEVVSILEAIRASGARIRVDYGFTDGPSAGKSWGEIHDVAGYVGRSYGPLKAPLLMFSKKCHGGGLLLDQCIVAIFPSRADHSPALYKHPKYRPAKVKV